jgi:hypothetical protein
VDRQDLDIPWLHPPLFLSVKRSGSFKGDVVVGEKGCKGEWRGGGRGEVDRFLGKSSRRSLSLSFTLRKGQYKEERTGMMWAERKCLMFAAPEASACSIVSSASKEASGEDWWLWINRKGGWQASSVNDCVRKRKGNTDGEIEETYGFLGRAMIAELAGTRIDDWKMVDESRVVYAAGRSKRQNDKEGWGQRLLSWPWNASLETHPERHK